MLVDLITFSLLHFIVGLNPYAANILSVSLGITNNYILNSAFNFRTPLKDSRRALSFYLIGVSGAITSSGILWLLTAGLGMSTLPAKVLSIPIIVLGQYVLNSTITFNKSQRRGLRTIAKQIRHSWVVIAIFILIGVYMVASSSYFVALDDMDNMLGGTLILRGELPYRDFFSHHSPGMYFVSALIVPFSGNDIYVFRVMFNILLFSLLIIFYQALRRSTSRTFGVLAVVWVALSQPIGFGNAALAESLLGIIIPFCVLWVLIILPLQRKTKTTTLVALSVVLFLISYLSIAYIFIAVILTVFTIIHLVKRVPTPKKWHELSVILMLFTAPYVLYVAFMLLTGSWHDFTYNVFTFNRLYYAPMVNEPSGSLVAVICAMLLGTVGQIIAVISNMLNPSYSQQILLLIGFIAFIAYFVINRQYVKSFVALGILLFSDTRVNAFNLPAISSDPSNISQHGRIYVTLALFSGAYAAWQLARTSLHIKSVRQRTVGLAIPVAYVTFTSWMLLYIAWQKLSPVLVTHTVSDYRSHAYQISRSNPAIISNHLTDSNDKVWLGPAEFSSQLFLERQRVSRFTFFLPWHYRAPETRREFISSITSQKPSIIYLLLAHGENYPEIQAVLDRYYFTIRDSRLRGFHFLQAERERFEKKLRNQGYET